MWERGIGGGGTLELLINETQNSWLKQDDFVDKQVLVPFDNDFCTEVIKDFL